jgi:uncharacterized protein (DUF4415 family)
MKRKGDTVRYTVEEIDDILAHGESRTDWEAVKGMTEQELEASIAADLDDVHEPIDWTRAVRGMPPRKHDIHIRLDEDVLDWFRQAGRGYQTRINNVLRAFMESRKRAPR